MANGDISSKSLEQLDEDIGRLLGDDSLSTKELIRGLIRTQRAMLPFFSQVVANTRRIDIMWAVFRPALVVGGTMMTLIVGFLWAIFTGQIELLIK